MEKIALGHFPEICGATRVIFRNKQYFDIRMGSPTSSTFLKTKKEIEGHRYKYVYRQYISDGDVQKYILLIKSFLEMYPETRGYFQNTFSKYELPILLGDNK